MNPTMGRTHLSHLGVPNHTAQLPQEKKPSRAPLRGGLFSASGVTSPMFISEDCKQT